MRAIAFCAALASSLSVFLNIQSKAAEITGAGSTFVNPIMVRWADTYAEKTGNKVRYQSVGSGAGIDQIKAAKIDFGASDMPMKPDDLTKAGLGQFPLVIGGVVPVVNIEGVRPGQIRFTGPILADIFLGKLKKWSDPAIRAINPDLKLADAPIVVVHRLDGSGTTFNWVNYLSKVSGEWKDKIGEGTNVEWPVGVSGRGNEGVAAYTSQIKNSIGYVEYTFALQYKLAYGLVQNKAGRFIKPDVGSFQAAAGSADWASAKDFYLVMTDAPGEGAYPVTGTTFVLMYKKSADANRTRDILDFFKWALVNGQFQASELNYVPLPASLVAQIDTYWKATFNGGL
jgi:phosphate transport system substrate-binding protein